MSETSSGSNDERGAVESSADPGLTIPARRLAGSARCLNCHVVLQGPYCHHCGQPDRRFRRVLPVLLRDLTVDLLDLDGRFVRTIAPLLLRPGLLSRDYIDGRRSRYTPPLRLYLFSSMLFFVLATLLGSDVVQVRHGSADGIAVEAAGSVDEDGSAVVASAGDATSDATAVEREASETVAQGIVLNGAAWDPVTNPVAIPFLPDRANGWINAEIEDSPRKARSIEENPRLITEKMYELLPATMFLLLPVAALLFQVWYVFSKRYFVEHLIFALHAHAFTFLVMSLALLSSTLHDGLAERGFAWASLVPDVLRIAALAWVPAYFLLALKRVYGQGWLVTLFKLGAIGACYSVLLGLATAVVTLASFLLL